MINISNASDINFEEIDIDPFWNTGEEREHPYHRIHSYPAKFPAFITKKAVDYASEKGVQIERIADVFCGCGTVAFESKRLGIDFWGCDINPVATLIAKTKSQSYQDSKIDLYYDRIMQHFTKSEAIEPVKELGNERIRYWFFDDEIKELSRLKNAILSTVPFRSKYRNFFLCAFSNILKPTSKWLTKSIKPQIDPEKQPADVLQAFKKQYLHMSKAMSGLSLSNDTQTTVVQGNSLNIDKTCFADLIITSPPYVTSYEYADLHQLSALWLEYADDYRELRQDTVGSVYNTTDIPPSSMVLNETGSRIVEQLHLVNKSKVKSVTKYFADMQKATESFYQLLKPNGMALIVIGNTEYKGVVINNAEHLIESLYAAGFKDVYITKRKIANKILTPYRDKNGRFSSNSNSRKVYSEEFIIVGRK